MRNCILGGDNFRAFRVDLGGQNSKGDNFQLYLLNSNLIYVIEDLNGMRIPSEINLLLKERVSVLCVAKAFQKQP